MLQATYSSMIAIHSTFNGLFEYRVNDPTPNNATMKKCYTSTDGRGLRPDKRDIGPKEYCPPICKYSKHATRICSWACSSDSQNTLYRALARVLMVEERGFRARWKR